MKLIQLLMLKILFISLSVITVDANLVKQGIKNVLDVCAVEDSVYYLNQFGVVYKFHGGKYAPMDLPDKIIQIQSVGRAIYLLREDGSVWKFHEEKLQLLEGDLPNQQMMSVGNTLYLLKRSGGLSQYENGVPQNLVYDRNFEVMAASGHNSIFLIDSWGRLFRFDTYSKHIELADPTRNSIQLVGGDGVLYILKQNGKVFKYEDLEFHPLNFSHKVRTMAAAGDFLYFIDEESQLHEYNLVIDRITQVDVDGKPQMIRITNGKLYVVEEDGDVFEYIIPSKKKQMQIQFHQMWDTPDVRMGNNGFQSSDQK